MLQKQLGGESSECKRLSKFRKWLAPQLQSDDPPEIDKDALLSYFFDRSANSSRCASFVGYLLEPGMVDRLVNVSDFI